jgi:hypothetical protein
MARITPLIVVVSAARTTSSQSAALTAPADQGNLSVGLVVTAASGTGPNLAVTVEWSDDGGTTWMQGDPADAFTAITAAANRVKQFAIKAPLYRIVWAITGTTPSFTFSVLADSGN